MPARRAARDQGYAGDATASKVHPPTMVGNGVDGEEGEGEVEGWPVPTVDDLAWV